MAHAKQFKSQGCIHNTSNNNETSELNDAIRMYCENSGCLENKVPLPLNKQEQMKITQNSN